MERLKEVIELIEQTGDKCVILHPDKGVYVLMKMDDYRALVTKNPFKTAQNSHLAMPNTDIRVYEIPQLSPLQQSESEASQKDKEEDQYFPEPLS